MPLSRKQLPWLLLILLLVLLAYLPAFKLGFTNYDDKRYILENQNLGFSLDNIRYFFSHSFDGHYHPLTMLSLMFDHLLFGFNASGYHISNLLLHLLNTSLVFIFVTALLKNEKIALVCALLFGITPLGVESVAWLSERKNLLYSFFYLLGLITYLRYHDTRKKKFYWFTMAAFILSLLSKAQAVIFPFTLLLIDYYQKGNLKSKREWLEKIPYFLLAIAFGILAIQAQNSFWQNKQIEYDLFSRIIFAARAFSLYIFKLIIPLKLSAIYPYSTDPGQELPAYLYLFLIVPVLYLSTIFYFIRKNPLLSFSLLFFGLHIGFLLKLTGTPYGDYFMADRYTYLASIGIYIILGHLLFRLSQSGQKGRKFVYAVFALYAIFFGVTTFQQSKTWESGISLWKNVLKHYPQNYQALNDLGTASAAAGDNAEAEANFRKAIALHPDESPAYNNYGNLKARQGNYREAILLFDKAIQSDPAYAMAYNNRALAYEKTGQLRRAIEGFKTATRLKPQLFIAWVNLAEAYRQAGQASQALEAIEKALSIHTEAAFAYELKSSILIKMEDYVKALNALEKAEELGLSNAGTQLKKGICHYHLGNFNAALQALNMAYKAGSREALIFSYLGFTHYQLGNFKVAIGFLNQAISYSSQDAMLFAIRGMCRLRMNETGACDDLQKAYTMGLTELRNPIEKNCK